MANVTQAFAGKSVLRRYNEGAPPLSGVYVAVDSSRLKFDASANPNVIWMPDGGRYLIPSSGNPQYIDRNGNTLTFDKSINKWTDTLGRSIGFLLANQSTNTQDVNLTGLDGQTMTFKLVWKNLADVLTSGSIQYTGSLLCSGSYPPLSPSLFTSPSSLERICGNVTQFNPVVLGEILLPNDGPRDEPVAGVSGQRRHDVEGLGVSRTYDLAGHALAQNYPSTRSVTQTYAASGRLASAGGNLGGNLFTYADTFDYNPAGQVLKERFGSSTNLYHRQAFNNRFQMIETRLGTSSTDSQSWDRGALIFYYSKKARNVFQPFSNQDDNSGNVWMGEHYAPVTVSGGTVTSYAIPQHDRYEYDSLSRIQSVTSLQSDTGGNRSQPAAQTFSYDRWGNRTGVSGYGQQTWDATEAAATNRVKLPSGNNCSGTKNGICYDLAGNVIFDNQLGAAGDRTYDAENRMISGVGGGLNKYVYDADGRRVRRQVAAQQFWQVYGINGELIAEYEWNGTTATLQKEYGYRNGELLIVAESSATVRWLVKDHLGTPRMIAHHTGDLNQMKRHDYLPFGEENLAGSVRTTGNGYQNEGVRQKFTGSERDGETGLDYAQARYFASSPGRFSSVDPLMASASVSEPQSWNRYAYSQNNPCKFIDPTGTKEISAEECKKNPRCVTISLNVIYDSNSNNGKGLTDKQKEKFEKEQLQSVKDEYGDALIHFETTYTEGAFDNSKGKISGGIVNDAINIVATAQQLPFNTDAVSQVKNGIAVSAISISTASKGILGHELAHHFLGHTTSSIGRAMSSHGGPIGNVISNTFADLAVMQARFSLATFGPSYGVRADSLLPGQQFPITTPFSSGARSIQQFLIKPQANRPRQ